MMHKLLQRTLRVLNAALDSEWLSLEYPWNRTPEAARLRGELIKLRDELEALAGANGEARP